MLLIVYTIVAVSWPVTTEHAREDRAVHLLGPADREHPSLSANLEYKEFGKRELSNISGLS